MRRVALSIVAVILGLMLGPAALADWNHPVKWDQLDPDDGLWGGGSYDNDLAEVVLADDFMCNETGWITDIEFNGWADPGVASVKSFRITFWSDVPATDEDESHPGDVPLFTTKVGPVDPADPLGLGWQQVDEYLYKINLPRDAWFLQQEGNIYWIGIQGIMDGTGTFGWVFRDRNACMWGDDASYSVMGSPLWAHWGWPDAGPDGMPSTYEGKLPVDWDKSADMSFRLTGIPEPASIGLVALAVMALVARRKR